MKQLLGALLMCWTAIASAGNILNLNVPRSSPDFAVMLPGNPTTGFQWTVVSYDKKLLKLKSSNFERQSTLIGAGGQMHFTFGLLNKNKHPESTTIKFKYARSWEPETATMKTAVIHFTK